MGQRPAQLHDECVPQNSAPQGQRGQGGDRNLSAVVHPGLSQMGGPSSKGSAFYFFRSHPPPPPTSLHRNDTQEKTEQAEQGREGSNQSPAHPCPQPTAEPTDPGGGRTGQQPWVLRFGSSRGSCCTVTRLPVPALNQSLLPDPSKTRTCRLWGQQGEPS